MIELEAHIKNLMEWFRATGEPLYMVGGYVRSALLGLPSYDMDVCSPLPAEELRRFSSASIAVTEREYGLGTVVITQSFGGKTYEYEYTTFRRDSYGRGGHRPDSVCFTTDIALDAARRDFTVNALYMDGAGNVLDPTGRGLEDIAKQRLAMCGADTMEQDALRILRLCRFAAQLGFAPEQRTEERAAANAPQLAGISAERLRDEFVKTIMADAAYGNEGGVMYGLMLLWKLGALEHIVPELLAGEGFAQTPKYHAYDVLEHSFRSCAAAPPDVTTRLAALLHDVEKPDAYRQDGNMYRHAELSAMAAGEILLRLKFENRVVKNVVQLIAAHMYDLENEAGRASVNRMLVKLGREQFLRLCDLREADFIGSGRGADPASARKWRGMLAELEAQDAPLTLDMLAVTGEDLMRELNMPQGREVGELLSKLHALALKKPSQNNYKNLIRYATMMYTGKLYE